MVRSVDLSCRQFHYSCSSLCFGIYSEKMQNYLCLTVLLITWSPLVKGSSPQDHQLILGTFPEGFAFGTATAAYQIEGAWQQDGKQNYVFFPR